MPLSQNRASEIKFEGPLSSIGAPELKTVLLSLDGAPEYCHSHKKPPQIENTPEVCTAGSRVVGGYHRPSDVQYLSKKIQQPKLRNN